jgi:hypothetical protein
MTYTAPPPLVFQRSAQSTARYRGSHTSYISIERTAQAASVNELEKFSKKILFANGFFVSAAQSCAVDRGFLGRTPAPRDDRRASARLKPLKRETRLASPLDFRHNV